MKLIALVLLPVAAQACKCLNFGGGNNVGDTQICCLSLDGAFQGGNDCAASSISEHLSNFRLCCEARGSQTSDCDFP